MRLQQIDPTNTKHSLHWHHCDTSQHFEVKVNLRSNPADHQSSQAITDLHLFISGVFINNFSSFHCRIQKLFGRQVKLPFPYMQSDIYESHCSPISSDHSASPLSELTSAEHIVAISLAWCMISVLFCC